MSTTNGKNADHGMSASNGVSASNGRPSTARPQQAVYLQLDPDPVFAVLHAPSADKRQRVGVVLCAPFGWEEICAHRSFLRFAEAVADAGYPALRFDLPGSGESAGSPRDPARLDTWTKAVDAAASWLKSAADCDRVVAIGVGLGGMLAYLAASEGGAVDDLVLWSVPAKGDAIVRELRAMAMLAADTAPRPAEFDSPAPEDGELEVWGFLLSGETATALKSVDLTEREIPGATGRRVLLLGRDQSAVDARLLEHLEQSGASVTSSPGPGYEAMVRQPKIAEVPYKTFGIVTAWLKAADDGEQSKPIKPTRQILSSDHMEIDVHDSSVRESPLELETPAGVVRGVLVEPLHASSEPAPLCGVLLNSGAVRRIGMNRIWVETSRRWAARGVPTLRLDLPGLGDSDGDERAYAHPDAFYRTEFVAHVVAALDALEARGLPGGFVLSGLCAGAYWSHQTALADERVHGTLMLNLYRFSTASELDAGRIARRARQLYRSGVLWSTMRDAVADGTITAMLRAIARNPRKVLNREPEPEISTALNAEMAQLEERAVARTLLMSLGEPIAQDIIDAGLDEAEPWPGVTLERIPIRDHGFRPVWAQQFVNDALDRGLDRAISAAGKQLAPAS
jgi:pimeloyl-ACP methyl ester carboxylesterase